VRPGKVKLRIGDPIPTRDLKLRDRGALTDKIRATIVAMLEDRTSL
jgi:hypothetical protein